MGKNRKMPRGFVSLGEWGNYLNKDVIVETIRNSDSVTYKTYDGATYTVKDRIEAKGLGL